MNTQEKRAKISFWITVVSFFGSLIFIANMMLFGEHRSPECKECVKEMLYYYHRADSLENVLHTKKSQR
jgi:hypothetical protein